MEEETPIKGLTRWFKGLNDKSSSKLLLIHGESGIGKTYFIESHLSKKLKLKPLTNDKIDELMDEKPSNYSSFLSLFFDVITFDDIDDKKKIMVINEKILYNFEKCSKIIIKLIDDSIKLNYPIVIIIDSEHKKLISNLEKKAITIRFNKPSNDEVKKILNMILIKNNISDKINPRNKGRISNTLNNKICELSNNNLNKVFVLINNLINNYCDFVNDSKVITKNSFIEFLKDTVENNNKNNIYVSNYKLLTKYESIDNAMELYNNDNIDNPLIMEESYSQKIIAYENANGTIEPIKDIILRLTKSFTYSNLIDTYIYNSQQWTNLKRIYGYFSCVLPSYLLSKIEVDYSPNVKFLSDMNKTSIQKINTKQIFNVYENFDIINIDYYIYIGNYIKSIISQCVDCKNKDNHYHLLIKKFNEFVKYYKINQSTIERLLKINKLDLNQIKINKSLDQLFI